MLDDSFPCLSTALPELSLESAPGLPLSEMAGGIAHDFRNVLAVIASALDLARRNQGDPAKLDQFLAAGREAVDRATKLTSRLLVAARPSAPSLSPENLSSLVREALPFLGYAADPLCRLRLDLCDTSRRCLVDVPRFNAALVNLVANARDAMPGGGEIRIRTRVAGAGTDGSLEVRVSDEGEGIKPHVAAHIFDPWFTTKADKGTGLGLPQVMRFMTLVGGRVRVSAGSPRGSCFDLVFPLLPVDQAEAGTESAAA